LIERFQDYQLTIPTLPVGGLESLALELDSDAPFALRLTKTRNMPAAGYRFKTPSGLYVTGRGNDTAYAPELSLRGTVRYPQMVYNANSYLIVDVPNTTGAPIENVRILFRGSKLYRDGQIQAPTYPAKCSAFPFVYPIVKTAVPGQTNAQFNNVQLQIKSDSDFALRYAFADSFHFNPTGSVWTPPVHYSELYVTLRDSEYKPYSNEPIHIDDLFGSINTTVADSAKASLFPNLFTPEIYIPRSGSLYFDILRNDPGGDNIDLHFRFCGAKVFHR
jgi:hypothetical protein